MRISENNEKALIEFIEQQFIETDSEIISYPYFRISEIIDYKDSYKGECCADEFMHEWEKKDKIASRFLKKRYYLWHKDSHFTPYVYVTKSFKLYLSNFVIPTIARYFIPLLLLIAGIIYRNSSLIMLAFINLLLYLIIKSRNRI